MANRFVGLFFSDSLRCGSDVRLAYRFIDFVDIDFVDIIKYLVIPKKGHLVKNAHFGGIRYNNPPKAPLNKPVSTIGKQKRYSLTFRLKESKYDYEK